MKRLLNMKSILYLSALMALSFAGCGDDTNGDPTSSTNPDADTSGDMQMAEDTEDMDPDEVDLPDPTEFTYSTEYVFQMGDVLGGFDGVRAADDPEIICTTGCEDDLLVDGGVTLYPIDNGFSWDVVDYVGATLCPRDGVHQEGFVGPIEDEMGNHQGIAIATQRTRVFKAGPRKGQWCAGLGGELAKCKSDHYVTMEHVLTCDETIPYRYFDPITGEPTLPAYAECQPLDDELDGNLEDLTPYAFDLENLVSTSDYSMINGETPGEYKYAWGNHDKRPVDVRLHAKIPLPDEWKEPGREFLVTRAELSIVHTITNNPNDQINPEDLSNEGATGRLPAYEVDEEGRWLSTRDCYEGDGDFIPAGTVLKNPAFADPNGHSADLVEGFTNAWYTTLDREPFEPGLTSGPRWRLKAPKFGQDLPGVEIPVEPCTTAPLKKEQIKYTRGNLTTTTINLLDPYGDGGTPFSSSLNWVEPSIQIMATEDMTNGGVVLSEDFDLSMHIKGDVKPIKLYRAVLYLDYEEI